MPDWAGYRLSSLIEWRVTGVGIEPTTCGLRDEMTPPRSLL
jgi:hypothetical protein